MPTITITVNDATTQRVQEYVDNYNAKHGTSLSAVQWVKQLVLAHITASLMADEQQAIEEDHAAEKEQRIVAKRAELDSLYD